MRRIDKILEHAKNNGGIIRSLNLKDLKIHRQYLSDAFEKGLLEKIARGLYILPNFFEDKMYVEQLLSTKLIYSHSTAAYYLDLTNRDPLVYTATLPRGYNSNKLNNSTIQIKYASNKETYNLGITQIKTEYGNYVKIYDAEKTVCDLIKSKKNVDPSIFTEVLNNYFKRYKKDIGTLIKYAKIMKIEKDVRNYSEVMI